MLTDSKVAGSDDWYLFELASELGRGFPRLKTLDSYVDGTFVVPIDADPSSREAYKKFANKARLTFGNTIVEQKVGRMNLRGFRTAADDDANGDRVANRIMRLNRFKVQFRDMQRKKTTHGRAFFVVGLDDQGVPFVTMRDSWTMAARMNALRPGVADAAVIATWDAVNSQDVLTLLRPGYMRVAVRPAKRSTIPTDGTEWQPGLNWDWTSGPVPLGFTDRIPVAVFENPGGLGEFEIHLDSIDRVTQDILERLTTTAMQAFRQRAIETGEHGALPERYPDDHPERPGELIDYDEIFKSGPAALWLLPRGARVWESSPIDPRSLTAAEKEDLEHLASVSGTPLYQLSPDSNQSAEGAKLQRETIRSMILDRRERDAESLAEVMSLLFEAYGDEVRADPTEIVTIWGQMEYVSKADVAEAARAAKQGGMSQRGINEHIYEMTPEEMALEEQSLRDEQFQMALMGVTTVGGNTGNGGSTRAAETLNNDPLAEDSAGALG